MITNDCIGKFMEKEWDCTFKDYILYALGVGASEKELEYIYEKNLKVIPTIATLPYNLSLEDNPYLAYVSDRSGILHASNELKLYHPLPEKGGKLKYRQTLIAAHDMGEKGAQFVSQSDLFDEEGTLLASSIDTEFSRFDGGWGGPARPTDTFPRIPEREADLVVTDHIAKGQSYLYRLSGDYYPLHADPEYAKSYGFKEPILHGLCTYGYICRMAIGALIPGEPERLTGMKGRFKNPVYTGIPISLHLWKAEEPGKAYYRLIDDSTGKIVVDRGELCWKA